MWWVPGSGGGQAPEKQILLQQNNDGTKTEPGIPSCLQEGPCSLGQLITLTPNTTLLQNWKEKGKLAGQRRSYTEFDEN